MPTIGRGTTKESIYIFKLDIKNAVFFSIQQNIVIVLSIYPYKKDIIRSKYY
jgi:hypothetical protein